MTNTVDPAAVAVVVEILRTALAYHRTVGAKIEPGGDCNRMPPVSVTMENYGRQSSNERRRTMKSVLEANVAGLEFLRTVNDIATGALESCLDILVDAASGTHEAPAMLPPAGARPLLGPVLAIDNGDAPTDRPAGG